MKNNELQVTETSEILKALQTDTLKIYLALYQMPDHIRSVIPASLVFHLEKLLYTASLSFPEISPYAHNISRLIVYTYLKASGEKVSFDGIFPDIRRSDAQKLKALRHALLEEFPPEEKTLKQEVILPQWPNYRLAVTVDRRVQGVSLQHPLPFSSAHADQCLAIPDSTYELLSAPVFFGDYLYDENGKVNGIQCSTVVTDRIYGEPEGPIEMSRLTLAKSFTMEKNSATDQYRLWLFRRYELTTIDQLISNAYKR